MGSENNMEVCEQVKVGYKVKLCGEVDGQFRCPLCLFLLRNPVQTTRGELACETCYRETSRRNGLCPIDNEPLETTEFFNDKFKTREILNLNCYCFNKMYGCPWKGTVGKVEDHQTKCNYKPIQCNYCDVDVAQADMVSHLNVCEKFSVEGKCFYEGCSFKSKNAEDLKCHLERDVILHTLLHTALVSNFQTEMNNQLQLQREQEKEKERRMEDEVKSLKEQFSLLMKNTTEIQRNSEKVLNNLREKVQELENRPSPTANQLSGLVHNDFNGPNAEILSSKINVLNQNISDLKLRQQLFENTCYEGKILWKIDNVSKRINQAINGKVTALHSAPTFTDKYGYKFCGRLYLNGDGVGRGTHISLFLVLMKSEYDNLLTWPFNKKITLRLLNQTNANEDIKESFHSDVRSSSFAQPKKEMNVASGCPMFITKEHFLNGGFIKDDTAFIELSVVI